MLCLVRYLFVISTSVVDCLGRFALEMTYYVWNETLNLAQLNSTQLIIFTVEFVSVSLCHSLNIQTTN